MTDEKVERCLKIVAENRARYRMTNEDAIKHLENLASMPALTVPEMIALGIAINALEKPAQGRWVKTEDQLPETNTPILMAVRNKKRYRYYAGRYYMAGEWVLESDLQDDFFSQLYGKPDYWCYIDEPEVPE